MINTPDDRPADVWWSPDVANLLSEPLIADSRTIGVLGLVNKPGGFTQDDARILKLFASQAAIAIEIARLHEQAEQLAIVEERQRLARELHDSVTQSLYSVILYADAAIMTLSTGKQDLTTQHLQVLRETAEDAMREMRLLVFQLHPLALGKEGLAAALRARLTAVEARAGFETEFKCEGEVHLPLSIQAEIYQIAQEVLNNVVKHAKATRVSVELLLTEKTTTLDIHDDGIGFDPTSARKAGGFGLTSIEERAAKMGGTVLVQSEVSHGTRVRVEIPVPTGASGADEHEVN